MTDQNPANPRPTHSTSVVATLALALMRIGIGWHFLHEGMVKLLDREWTAWGYLQSSTGPLADSFHRIAADPTAMKAVDLLNVWGLLLIGLCLMLGLFTRLAAFCGVSLLALYYAAYPPVFAAMPAGVAEGHYLVVNKNLVEALALLVVLALPTRSLGLDGIRAARRARRREAAAPLPAAYAGNAAPYHLGGTLSRRRILSGLIGVPFVGGYTLAFLKKRGWDSHEESQLAARPDARTGATIKKFDFSATLKDLKGRMPQGEIRNVKFSRLILGGNLIGGWAHARDLIYVSKLIKAYHHREKVFETLRLAEACGVNTILTNPILCDIINDYWKSTGGKIQFISDCGSGSVLEQIRKSIDNGACACYIQGAATDALVKQGKFDVIEQSLDLMRKNNVPAGIGAHELSSIVACVERGYEVDFWMKTLHDVNYWSAKPQPECDNIWCTDPAKTIEFMGKLKQPWIAFKVLAAGAHQPQYGFRYAFEHGADFICVGMYDFQMIEDVNIAFDILKDTDKLNRRREWFA